ncbi:MAG: hypothetical protein ACOZAN_04025 [Patescibacteria group bacterium]
MNKNEFLNYLDQLAKLANESPPTKPSMFDAPPLDISKQQQIEKFVGSWNRLEIKQKQLVMSVLLEVFSRPRSLVLRAMISAFGLTEDFTMRNIRKLYSKDNRSSHDPWRDCRFLIQDGEDSRSLLSSVFHTASNYVMEGDSIGASLADRILAAMVNSEHYGSVTIDGRSFCEYIENLLKVTESQALSEPPATQQEKTRPVYKSLYASLKSLFTNEDNYPNIAASIDEESRILLAELFTRYFSDNSINLQDFIRFMNQATSKKHDFYNSFNDQKSIIDLSNKLVCLNKAVGIPNGFTEDQIFCILLSEALDYMLWFNRLTNIQVRAIIDFLSDKLLKKQ